MNMENETVSGITAASSENKAINKKIFIAAAALAVIVLTVIIFALNTPFGKFRSNIENGDISAAESIYTDNKDNEKFAEKCRLFLAENNRKIYDKYINKNIDFDEAINEINSYASIYKDEDIIGSINDIAASRKAFSQGETLLADKKYAEAIEMFSKVIQDDTENYEASQNQIEVAADMLCTEAIENSQKLVEQNKFMEAFLQLDALDFEDERIEAQKQSIIAGYEKDIINSAEQKMVGNDYAGAVKIYSEIPDEMFSDNLKSSAKKVEEKYEAHVSGLADEYIKKQDYASAVNLIEREKQKSGSSVLDKLLNSTKNKYAENIIGKADKLAAAGDYAEAFRTILAAGEDISSSKLEEAEQKYRDLLDSQKETYTKYFDGEVTVTYTIKYYTDYFGSTAYKSFTVDSLSLINDSSYKAISDWNGYAAEWVNNYAFPSGAAYEITRSQYEEMYLQPHEYVEFDHLIRSNYYLSLSLNLSSDSGYYDEKVHMMELLYGTEVTAQSLFGGLFW